MLNLPLSVMEAFDAQFERELIRERLREGIVIAKREGKYSCRKHVSDTRDPPGYSQYRQTPVACINLPPLLKSSPWMPGLGSRRGFRFRVAGIAVVEGWIRRQAAFAVTLDQSTLNRLVAGSIPYEEGRELWPPHRPRRLSLRWRDCQGCSNCLARLLSTLYPNPTDSPRGPAQIVVAIRLTIGALSLFLATTNVSVELKWASR
jgi:hypothetical protein